MPRKAGEFVFQMVGGPQQLLSMYKGKTIVLAFMYTTCPHCQKTAQVLAKVQHGVCGKGSADSGRRFRSGRGGPGPAVQ